MSITNWKRLIYTQYGIEKLKVFCKLFLFKKNKKKERDLIMIVKALVKIKINQTTKKNRNKLKLKLTIKKDFKNHKEWIIKKGLIINRWIFYKHYSRKK